MTNFTQATKFTLLILSFLYLLTACGGGDSGGTLPQQDTTPPTISIKKPENRESDVAIIQPITVTFSEAIKTVSENNVALFKYLSSDPNNFDEGVVASKKIMVSVQVDNNKLTIIPNSNYTNEARYKIALFGIKDKANNPMADSTWEFATTTIPRANIEPSPGSTVFRATDVIISFSEPMDPTSLDGFILQKVGAVTDTIPTMSKEYNESDNTVRYSLPKTTPTTYLIANSEYTATLSGAKDLNGNIAQPITSTFKTNSNTINIVLPTKPTNVTAIAHNTKVDVSWGAAPPIAGKAITYNVYVAIDGGTYLPIQTTAPITGTSYTHSNINNNKLYQYAVTANATGQESQKVFSISAVRPLDVISTGNMVITATAGDGTVTLNWPATTPPAVSYKIYVKVGTAAYTQLNKDTFIINGTRFVHDKDPTNTKLTSTGLKVANGTLYTYKISAINANADEGPQSTSESNSVTQLGPPPIPAFSRANAGNSKNILTWTPPAAAENIKYVLKVSTGGTFSQLNVTSLPYVHGNLNDGSQYTYKLTAVYKQGSNFSTDSDPVTLIPFAPKVLNISYDFKVLNFDWAAAPGATHYRLLENPDGAFGFINVLDGNITGITKSIAVGITQHGMTNARYVVEACYNAQCDLPTSTTEVGRLDSLVNTTALLMDDKIPTLLKSKFGASIALSADGTTLAVGLSYANVTGSLGRTTEIAGAVNMYKPTINSTTNKKVWIQQGLPLISTRPEQNGFFGEQVALSNDGKILAVGCSGESAVIKGVLSRRVGAVYMFRLKASGWTKFGLLKSPQPDLQNDFGKSITISGDGQTLAVTEKFANINSVLLSAGKVWMYRQNQIGNMVLDGSTAITGNTPTKSMSFGMSVSLNFNGTVLAVGDWRGANWTGGVTVFNRSATAWQQPGTELFTPSLPGEAFGWPVVLSSDGNVLVVGEGFRSVKDNQGVLQTGAGAAIIFTKGTKGWKTVGQMIVSANPKLNGYFGSSFAMNNDGSLIAFGDGGDVTHNGNIVTNAGSVIFYNRKPTGWQVSTKPLMANTPIQNGGFGGVIAFDSISSTMAVSEFIFDVVPINTTQIFSDKSGVVTIY